MANKIQTTLVKDSATIPKHIPDRKSRLKSSSRIEALQRTAVTLVIINVVLVAGAIFLSYRISSKIVATEDLRRTISENRQEVHDLAIELAIVKDKKMKQLLGNNYTEVLDVFGQQ